MFAASLPPPTGDIQGEAMFEASSKFRNVQSRLWRQLFATAALVAGLLPVAQGAEYLRVLPLRSYTPGFITGPAGNNIQLFFPDVGSALAARRSDYDAKVATNPLVMSQEVV